MTTEHLSITVTKAEAESIVRADYTATSETRDAAVSNRVLEAIAQRWPELRARYNVNMPDSVFYELAEHKSNRSTHTYLLLTHTWPNGGPSEAEPMPTERYYAAPELEGVAPDQPFCTALARESDLIVLTPVNVPDVMREIFYAALEAVDLKHRPLDDRALRDARQTVIARWERGIADGEFEYNVISKMWELR